MELPLLLLYALPFTIAGFIFEAYPRFINRYCGVDIWTHLLYLQEYHRQKGIPRKIENGFLVQGTYDYPPAFIFIMSKFPISLVERYEFLFSPFFDSIHLIVVFVLSYLISNSLLVAFLTQILYLLTPIIVLENSSATPRSLGYTLFSIVFISLFFFETTSSFYYIVIAIFAGIFIFLSHRFTTQAFFFFAVLFSIIRLDYWYLLVFVASSLLAVIVSKGFYLRVLQGHLGNLEFWRNNIQYRFAHQVRGIREQHKTKDFVFRLYNQFLRFPPFVLGITNPWVITALYYFIAVNNNGQILIMMGELILMSYILSLATIWMPQLRFLGEGQRYLELTAFPAAFLSAVLYNTMLNSSFQTVFTLGYIIVGILAFFTIVVIQRKAIIKDRLRTLTPDLQQMYTHLRSLKSKPRLLCIPHQITTNTIYHTGCPVFVNADYSNIVKISDVYPFMRKPIKRIIQEYNLDAVLLNQDYASIKDLGVLSPIILKRSGTYVLFKVKQ